MSLEHLRHTPEFELPPNAPGAPADLISLIEECHDGLAKAVVSKMVRRGKYDQIATIICQDNPSKKTRPLASADDIADYCMMCMQYDVDKTDEPGTYKVALFGPPGKGRFERSKHVDLGEGDGSARSKTMMTEGELIEQQSQYIGELHSQSIAVLETLHGMVKPLLQENKEMMKIISESARRLAEIERDRMKFDLELRMHNDEIKLKEAEEEEKTKRWNETMEVIKDSGMVEGFMKAIIKKLNPPKKEEEDDDGENEVQPENKKRPFVPKINGRDNEVKEDDKYEKKSKVEKAKSKSRKKKKKSPISKKTQQTIEQGGELSQEQLEEVFEASGMEKARENPIALMVEVLRMSIDDGNQWGIVQETLSEEQFKLFKKITETDNDADIEKLLKQLFEMKGSRRFMKLEEHLNDDQKKYVDKLLEIAMS